MDKSYVELFRQLAQTTAVSAETVMEYDRAQGDEQGLKTATMMREDYQALAESLDNLGEDYSINKEDVARLLVGAMIQVNQLQDRIASLKNALVGYQTDLIPKLKDILDNASDDEEASKMANEKFILEDNK